MFEQLILKPNFINLFNIHLFNNLKSYIFIKNNFFAMFIFIWTKKQKFGVYFKVIHHVYKIIMFAEANYPILYHWKPLWRF